MAEFYVLVEHALTTDERVALEGVGCTIAADPAPTASTGYVAQVPADDESEALDKVASAGIDDATIWREFPEAALP
ncbi:MAG TPA: hypothetical protein VF257_07370 [Solirubrobacteraceae bacterium]